MAETDAATTITPSVSTAVTQTIGPASETATAGQVFNPQTGYWLSDPLVLSGTPVTGSIVRWNAVMPANSTITVQTSINNGASWDTATNNQPVPRLREGDTTTRTVLAQITLTWTTLPSLLYPSLTLYPSTSLFPTANPVPTVTSFEMRVSTDADIDELIPIGMGMIDEVTTHASGGSSGSGATTNATSSTAVRGSGSNQSGGGTSIKVHANDLSFAIKRNVWQQPFTLPSGMLYTDAVKAMVLNRLPDQAAFNLATTTRVTPVLLYGAQQGGDPWQDITELAQAIGFEVFFDPTGVLVCRPVPDPSVGKPVYAFDENAVQLVAEASFALSSDQTFNDIVVLGQSTSSKNPFSAEAYNNDANSPTYIRGPYGRVSQRLTFSTIMTQEQAQATAYSALYASLGAANTTTLVVVPNPALEPGDIIKVVCSNVQANGTYMINSMKTPLSPTDPQELTCFRQSTSGSLAIAGGRGVTDGVVTLGSNTVTSATANFVAGDVGASIYGAGIPINTTISSVTNSTTAVMSALATASGTSVYVVISVASGT